jgi:hypothetical protein
VHFLDDTVPALAAAGSAMRAELTEHSSEVRHAVALGRYLRAPPAVVAALAAGGEATALPLSPLQECLTEEEKSSVLERGLMVGRCMLPPSNPS